MRRNVAILLAAMLPVAVLNGYALALSTGPFSDAEQTAPKDDLPAETPSPEGPTTGVPVAGLPTAPGAVSDVVLRSGRSALTVRSLTLPVGMWHGMTLSVPRPFSRLERLVAQSFCKTAELAASAPSVQAHAPPPNR